MQLLLIYTLLQEIPRLLPGKNTTDSQDGIGEEDHNQIRPSFSFLITPSQ